MARVDADNDGIRRFVVRHHRFDPERRERRHVIVDAFDNRAEFEAQLESIQRDIDRRKLAGEPVDRNEHASGVVWEPGHRQRAANGRQVLRALRHGVAPGPWLDRLDLPPNIAVYGPGVAGHAQGLVGRARRAIRRWLRGTARG
jgi:hypothetical protein